MSASSVSSGFPSAFPSAFRQALRLAIDGLRRDWRAGDLRLLAIAVILAVAALAAVGFVADRLNAGLQRDARALLGGDVVLNTDRATPEGAKQQAQALGLRSSVNIGFPTMARAPEASGGGARLVALKAVDANYPLRGRMQVQGPGEAKAKPASPGGPLKGSVWVDASLLDALNLKLGDPLLLGDASLKIGGLIAQEPDRGGGFTNFAPRVMLSDADLPATQLVQPASRVNWRMAVVADDASTAKQIPAYEAWVKARLDSGEYRGARLESFESGRPEMRQTLDRAARFLNLVALLSALLSAVAIAIAARGFAQSHLDSCAMLRVLGCSQRAIAWAYILEFITVGVIASLVGLGLGWLFHEALLAVLAGLVESVLPPPSIWPAALGLGVGLTLLVAFGLPPVLQLASVPPLRVIRRDLGGIKPASLGVLLVGVAGFAGLLLATSADLKLGGIAVGGFAVATAVFAALAWACVWALRRLVREETAPQWLLLATRQVTARPAVVVLQTSALSLGLLALVLLVLVRTDLVNAWRASTPPNAPNRFVINIQPEQRDAFRQKIEQAGVAKYDLFPMIRGRLVAVNGKAVGPETFADDRAKRMVDREFNLSHSAKLPANNQLIAGKWQDNAAGEASVEEGIAQTLGLKLGDVMRFDVGGMPAEAKITSLRKVDWGSMRANFFVLFTVDTMHTLPATFMSAYKAPAVQGFDNALMRQFPNVTNVDLSQTIDQVQRVLNQVTRAVEFLFGFTLLAGLVVLVATVSATREARAKEFAILRALGARASLLRQVQRAELAGVGLLAGVMASVVAMLVAWAMAKFVFEFSWSASLWVPFAGGACGAALALAAGWWSLREVLTRPVVATLRQAAD